MEEGGSRPSADTGLEESMWQLSLGGGVSNQPAYPERPGEPECNYYMRTGRCDFGDKCRFNHPRNRVIAAASASPGVEYPERVGQPVCQYFLKTGSCKFGATCKYHHPRREGAVSPVHLNIFGYPMRKGEKECSYYVKNGNCKFGATCKFHHPQPAFPSAHEPAYPFYPSLMSPYQLSTMASWQGARTLPLSPGSYVPGPYGPVFIPSEMIPVPGWSPYVPPVNPVVTPESQPTGEEASLYGLSHQLSPSGSSYTRPYQPALPFPLPPSNGQGEHLFPERPDQPECEYYKKTGRCKFGSTCKFHHPSEKIIPKASYFLNPVGLPLRPGAPYCIFFAQHGVCKFGPSCKFDHPMGTLSYSPSTSSLLDMPVAPFPIGTSTAALAPASFSTDSRHGAPANTTFSISTISHSSLQAPPPPPQISAPSSNSCNGHGGEGTTSGIETQ